MSFTAVGFSKTGNHRSENQDAMAISDCVFVVADGMGGHPNGKEAAELVCEYIIERSRAETTKQFDRMSLSFWIESANREVLERYPGAGTTCSVFVLQSGDFFGAWIGDTRIYLFRRNDLQQISTDQNLATTSGNGLNAHVLTNHVGKTSMSKPGHITGKFLPEDLFLIASDGAYASNEASICEILQKGGGMQTSIRDIELSLTERDPRDNFTVILIGERDG